MTPGESTADRFPGKPVVFPFVNQHLGRRGKKGIVAELVDTNFCENNRHCYDIAEPNHVGSVHKIDKHGIDRPCRNRERQIAEILRTQFSFLEEEDKKKLGQNSTCQDSGNDDKGKAVLLLEMRESVKPGGKVGARVIRDQNRQHHSLENEARNRIRFGRFPTNRERRARFLHRR